ncbi:MAG: FGGY-family carbohydrate kinase, partial [Longimicrobiales bacterium]
VEARELRVDGGATANDWLMGFQADLLGVPVRRPAIIETTALGAAGLAGIARGVWEDGDAFMESREEPTVFEPELDPGTREQLVAGWHRAVRAAKGWATDAG